jgi:predicted GNAT family N-acyltransferase
LGEDPLEVRAAHDDGEIEAAKQLRVQVFSGEQGVQPEADTDGLDPEATHIVAVRRGEVVATCRLRFPQGRCKLERMVVERTLRGTGIGTALVEEAEREALRQGAAEVVLNAQRRAEGFYASCGYAAQGETFLEEGIPHVQMRKALVNVDRRSGRDRRAS